MPDPTRDFLVPDLGEGLEDATIVTWLVAAGDEVELNQPLCTVETAKAEVDLPSPYAGTVLSLGGDEGETLAVGSLLARIDTATPAAAPAAPGVAPPERAPTLVGSGFDEALDHSRRAAVAATPRPRAKPPVRRLARQLGVDLRAATPGSGPGGIVPRADVEAAAAGPSGPTVPVRGVRARIAERMTTAHSIPVASCRVVADCTRLLDVRTALNDRAAGRGLDPVVTPFSLLAALAVHALRADRVLNASFDAAVPAIRLHDAVHLGVATATDRGLLVPVVREAQALAVHALSAELARLADAARTNTIAPAELTGSTFTISNFGALGLDDGTPMINHPEAAILGVGAIRRRPHVVDDEVVPRSTASLTLVFDHRVCDGTEAGRYLTELRALIEAPELALL